MVYFAARVAMSTRKECMQGVQDQSCERVVAPHNPPIPNLNYRACVKCNPAYNLLHDPFVTRSLLWPTSSSPAGVSCKVKRMRWLAAVLLSILAVATEGQSGVGFNNFKEALLADRVEDEPEGSLRDVGLTFDETLEGCVPSPISAPIPPPPPPSLTLHFSVPCLRCIKFLHTWR
jgi:hypothetical protein